MEYMLPIVCAVGTRGAKDGNTCMHVMQMPKKPYDEISSNTLNAEIIFLQTDYINKPPASSDYMHLRLWFFSSLGKLLRCDTF